MKFLGKFILVSLLFLCIVSGVSADIIQDDSNGYIENLNYTATISNTTRSNAAGGLTATAQNMTIWFQEFQSIGTPTRFFYSSANSWHTNWITDDTITTGQTPVTFHKTDNTTQFGTGMLYYQVQQIGSTPKFINVWIDVTSWDVSLIGSPSGAYNVFLRYDRAAINGLSLYVYVNNGVPSSFGHSKGFIFKVGVPPNVAVAPSTSAYYVLSSEQEWGTQIIVDYNQGESIVSVIRNNQPSNVKINSSVSIYHDSYDIVDLVSPYDVYVYEPYFNINVTNPFNIAFNRLIINRKANILNFEILKTTGAINENLVSNVSYIGVAPLKKIEYWSDDYAVAGQPYAQYSNATGSWKKFNTVTNAYDISSNYGEATGQLFAFINTGTRLVQANAEDTLGNFYQDTDSVNIIQGTGYHLVTLYVRDKDTTGLISKFGTTVGIREIETGANQVINASNGIVTYTMNDLRTYDVNASAGGYWFGGLQQPYKPISPYWINIYLQPLAFISIAYAPLNVQVFDTNNNPITSVLVTYTNTTIGSDEIFTGLTNQYGAWYANVDNGTQYKINIEKAGYQIITDYVTPTGATYKTYVLHEVTVNVTPTVTGTGGVVPNWNFKDAMLGFAASFMGVDTGSFDAGLMAGLFVVLLFAGILAVIFWHPMAMILGALVGFVAASAFGFFPVWFIYVALVIVVGGFIIFNR